MLGNRIFNEREEGICDSGGTNSWMYFSGHGTFIASNESCFGMLDMV